MEILGSLLGLFLIFIVLIILLPIIVLVVLYFTILKNRPVGTTLDLLIGIIKNIISGQKKPVNTKTAPKSKRKVTQASTKRTQVEDAEFREVK